MPNGRLPSAACAMALILAPAVIAQPAGEPTVVADVEVRAPEQVPVPEVGIGAPLFSVGELEAIHQQARKDAQDAMSDMRRCEQDRNAPNPGNYIVEYDAATALRGSADQAVEATRRADEVRRAAARGEVTQQAVEEAELARQRLVRRVTSARAALTDAQAVTADLQWLALNQASLDPPPPQPPSMRSRLPNPTTMGRPVDPIDRNQAELAARRQARQYVGGQRVYETPRAFADLRIEGLATHEREAGGQTALVVTGAIRNPRRADVSMPPLSIIVLDRFGFPLKSALADGRRAPRIRPGQTQAFSYEIKPKPAAAQTVRVTFGPDEYEPWRLPASAVLAQLTACPSLNFPLSPTNQVEPQAWREQSMSKR